MVRLLGYLYGRVASWAGDLLYCAYNPSSPATTSRLIALTEDGFVTRCEPHPCASLFAGGVTSVPLLQPAPGVLLTYARTGVGGMREKWAPCGETNVYRSTDGGATWTACEPTYVHHIEAIGNGHIYAIDYGPAGDQVNCRVWHSGDDGATWTVRSTWVPTSGPIFGSHSGDAPSHIMSNPADPNRVIVRQNANWLSTDGGASFPIGAGAAGSFTVFREEEQWGAIGSGIYTPDGLWFVATYHLVNNFSNPTSRSYRMDFQDDTDPTLDWIGTTFAAYYLDPTATVNRNMPLYFPVSQWSDGRALIYGPGGVLEVTNGTGHHPTHGTSSAYHPGLGTTIEGTSLNGSSPGDSPIYGVVPENVGASRPYYYLLTGVPGKAIQIVRHRPGDPHDGPDDSFITETDFYGLYPDGGFYCALGGALRYIPA